MLVTSSCSAKPDGRRLRRLVNGTIGTRPTSLASVFPWSPGSSKASQRRRAVTPGTAKTGLSSLVWKWTLRSGSQSVARVFPAQSSRQSFRPAASFRGLPGWCSTAIWRGVSWVRTGWPSSSFSPRTKARRWASAP